MKTFPFRLTLLVAAAGLVHCGGNNGTTPPAQCANISGEVETAGLKIRRPEADATACIEELTPSGSPTKQCKKKDAPDFSCLNQPGAGGPSATVTMRGCIELFGLGASLDVQTVTFFPETVGGQPVDPGYTVTEAPGNQTDATPSAVITTVLSSPVAIEQCEDEFAFEAVGIPTETDLIVRVTHQNLPADERQFIDTYKYNVRLTNDLVVDADGQTVADVSACTPATCFVTEDINTIAIATFFTIPRAAGVSVIPGENDLFDGSGEGHIAGEVQDCTSEDTVQNAVVNVDVRARKLAYFNVDFPPERDDLDDPKPEGTRTRTNGDGLYAAIGVMTQTGGVPVQLGAAITPNVCGDDGICMCNVDGTQNPAWSAADNGEGETTVLGARTVFVFPDSITVLTFDRTFYQSR